MTKKIIILIFILAFLGIGLKIFAYPAWKNSKEEKIMLQYLTDSQLKDDYEEARKAEKKIKETPDELLPYLQAGFAWKILAETTGEEIFYQKTINSYSDAIGHFDMRYYMPYASLGGIYQSLGEYKKSEDMYKKALRIVPGEAPLYIKLAELYYYDMHKTPEEVLTIYDEGINRGLSPLPLMVAKAAYLRDMGYIEESIAVYEEIYEATGSDTYQAEIERLKLELSMVGIN